MIIGSNLDVTDFDNLKRVTFLKREFLERKQKGFYSLKSEIIILINSTDTKINNKLNELNKNKISRLFKIEKDFKLTSKPRLKEYKHYLIENDYM